MTEELRYWLALNQLPAVGAARISAWLEQAGNVAALFTAERKTLINYGLTPAAIAAIQVPDWAQVDQALAWLGADNRHHLITLNDPRYPALLKQITSPPIVLYIQGDPQLISQPQLAMVGSRNPTAAGKDTASEFARHLAAAGLVITSGLALGIDAASHQGALAAVGKTVAVLGSGLDRMYPVKNQGLAQAILAGGGTLISEFSLGTPPRSENFPRRNRIISGLSAGTLVVEAALQSGSLITAHYALEQGREVFAIPGSIHNPMARGCHRLLRQGAKLVETVHDVLEELNLGLSTEHADSVSVVTSTLAPRYAELLIQIDYSPTPIDLVVKRTGLDVAEVASGLLILELQGYVHASPMGYIRK